MPTTRWHVLFSNIVHSGPTIRITTWSQILWWRKICCIVIWWPKNCRPQNPIVYWILQNIINFQTNELLSIWSRHTSNNHLRLKKSNSKAKEYVQLIYLVYLVCLLFGWSYFLSCHPAFSIDKSLCKLAKLVSTKCTFAVVEDKSEVNFFNNLLKHTSTRVLMQKNRLGTCKVPLHFKCLHTMLCHALQQSMYHYYSAHTTFPPTCT